MYFIKLEIGYGKVPSGITAFVVNRKICSKLGIACLESGSDKPINEKIIWKFIDIRKSEMYAIIAKIIDDKLIIIFSWNIKDKKPKIIKYGTEVKTELKTNSNFEILKFLIKEAFDVKSESEFIRVSLKKNHALNPDKNQLK